VSPVPDYIYQSQPRCQSSLFPIYYNIKPLPAYPNWTCPRTAPYEPILAIPVEALRIDPDWADCAGGINGVYDPPIALTPEFAIAKPTLPQAAPQTTSVAVPASTPRPTLATMTPTAESNKASTPTSIADVHNPTPDSSHVKASPTVAEADDEQADHHDQSSGDPATISMGSSHSIGPTVHSIPTQDPKSPESRLVEHTFLNDAGSRSSIPSDRPKSHEIEAASTSQIDALSVLLAAQSSIDASTRQQNHDDQTKPLGLPATRTEPAGTLESPSDVVRLPTPLDPLVVTVAGGDPVTIDRFDSSVILRHDGSSFTAALGSQVSIGSHAFSAASDGGAIVIDHSATQPFPATNVQSPALATFVAGDESITAYKQGSAIILADGTRTQTLTAQLGGAVMIGSHTIDVVAGGHALVVGSSTVDIPSKADLEGDVFTSVQTADDPVSTTDATESSQDGQKLSVSTAENGIVVQQGASTVTLAAGQETTFNGHTLSVAQSGSSLIVDGSVMTLSLKGPPAVNTASNSRAADVADADAASTAGATNTVGETMSGPLTPQSSGTLDSSALGLMANASLLLRLLCLIVCMWAGMGLV